MSSQAPIFILCCERSGSTLLRYMLDTHPDICSPGELYLGRLIFDMRLTLGRSTARIGSDQETDWDRAAQTYIHDLLNSNLSCFAQARGKRIWCEKTPFNLHYLGDIKWAFPEARFLCLYRNGLDVAHSCLSGRQDGEMFSWLAPYLAVHMGNRVAAMLHSWVDKTEIILNAERQNPSTCRVKYEDLVTDPVKALEPVFEWLELELNSDLIDQVFKKPHDSGGGDFKIEKTAHIEKDRIGQGANLDPALIAKIPHNLHLRWQKLNEQLGYA